MKAVIATSIAAAVIWLLSNESSPFALLVVQQAIRFFWKAPVITALGFITATFVFSLVVQQRLQAGKLKGMTWGLFLFLFLLGYVVVINISHDIGFCFDLLMSTGSLKSYCQVQRYFSLFDWGARLFIGSLAYGVWLSILVLAVNFTGYKLWQANFS